MRTIQYGTEYWRLHDNGYIERPGLVNPTEQWRIVNAVEYTPRGKIKTVYSLAHILMYADKIPWIKNGKQNVFVRDYDHGTLREWRQPKHSIM